VHVNTIDSCNLYLFNYDDAVENRQGHELYLFACGIYGNLFLRVYFIKNIYIYFWRFFNFNFFFKAEGH
jgi:hypothetical protein